MAFILFWIDDRQQHTLELEVAHGKLQQCHSSVDSLTGVIAELEFQLSSAPVDTGSGFNKDLRFDIASPLPLLGNGVTAQLRATDDWNVDLLVLTGISGYSYSLGSDFEHPSGEIAVTFRTRRHFFIELKNGDVWGVNYLGRIKTQNTAVLNGTGFSS